MEDNEFERWLADELMALRGVEAVAVGGSRARGDHRPDSDWDFAVYYREAFDPASLRGKGWDGEVSDIGGWGGGVMNGGAWLSIDGRRVDVHYRDLDDVQHHIADAEAGRFRKELLLFYVAGIPTYTVVAELALHRLLRGDLPRPVYPEALSREAARRWRTDAIASLDYARAAVTSRGDVAVALANASRGLIEAAEGQLAADGTWVVNEKGIVDRASLGHLASALLTAGDTDALAAAIERARDEVPGDSLSVFER